MSIRLITHLPALLCGLLLASAAQAQTPATDVAKTAEKTAQRPALSEPAQKSFQEYLAAEGKKAFAVSDSGAYAFSSKQSSDENALRQALAECQMLAAMPCRITYLNADAFEPKYQSHAKASQAALKNLNTSGDQYKAVETLNWHIAAPIQLRSTEEGIHFPTPTQLHGIATINTDGLVEKITHSNIILIDTRYLSDEPDESLPNAYLLDFAGVAYADKDREKRIMQTLSRIMKQLAPNKSQAIAVFCASVECWLSVNAVLRLQALGYTNLFWYRGGVHAWNLAKLPTVSNVPFATLRVL